MHASGVSASYDATKLIKQLLLSQCQRLDISKKTPHTLTADDVATTCDAAKFIRTRIVREYERVRKRIDTIRQESYGVLEGNEVRDAAQNDDDEQQVGNGEHEYSALGHASVRRAIQRAVAEDKTPQILRTEFVFLGELRIIERVVVPSLCAHALQHPTTLLPQLLKLVAAMTMPVIADAPQQTQQADIMQSIRARCSTDEFFVMLVHAVAPIASKRKDGPLPETDSVLLEVVLSVICNLLRGSASDIAHTVGALCRNHGVELVLVLLSQNFSKYEQLIADATGVAAAIVASNEAQPEEDQAALLDQVDAKNSSETDEATPIRSPQTPRGALQSPAEEKKLSSDPSGWQEAPAFQRAETQLIVLSDTQFNEAMQEVGNSEQPQAAGAQSYSNAGVLGSTAETSPLTDGLIFVDEVETVSPAADDGGFLVVADSDAPAGVAGDFVELDLDDKSASITTDAASSSSVRSGSSEDEEAASETSDDSYEEEDVVVLDDDEQLIRNNPALAELAEDLQRETLATLRRWNNYLLEIVALVFRCAPAADVSLLALSLHSMSRSTPISASSLHSKVAAELKRQQCVHNAWRSVAKSRNGAFSTNSILVKRRAESDVMYDRSVPQQRVVVLGTTTSLMMGKHTDPLGLIKDMDRRKKGRFYKNMLEADVPVSLLPLPAQLHLAQQFVAFLSHGFETLSIMMWPRICEQLKILDENVIDNDLAAKAGARDGPLMSVQDGVDVREIMNYMFLCSTLLRFTRENLKHVLAWRREAKEKVARQTPYECTAEDLAEQQDQLLTFEAQWKAVSHIVTLDHIQGAFTLMSNMAVNKELATEFDISVPVAMAGELLLLLIHLLDGEIVDDPSVTMAAHAMGSSVLYKEENIRIVYLLVGEVTVKAKPPPHISHPLLMLLHALLLLIEKCSFNGALAMPKVPPKGRRVAAHADGGLVDVGERAAMMADGAGDTDEEESDDGSDADVMNETVQDCSFIVADDDDGVDSDEGSKSTDALPEPQHGPDVHDDSEVAQKLRDAEFYEKERRLNAEVPPDGEVHPVEPSRDDDEVSVYDEQPARDFEQEADLRYLRESEESGEESAHLLSSGQRGRSLESEESASFTHSSHTGNTSMASEREVKVQDFYLRLATPKYIPLVYAVLSSWKSNDADVNLALCSILDNLCTRSMCVFILFCFPFLMLFHDILSTGRDTHAPLVNVVDRIVYQFFNPSFARPSSAEGNVAGPNSLFGTEVALRCTRALFLLHPSHYSILQDAGVADATDATVLTSIALPQDSASAEPPRKRRGKLVRVHAPELVQVPSTHAGIDEEEAEAPIGQVQRDAVAAPRRSRRNRRVVDDLPVEDVTAVAKEVDSKERGKRPRKSNRGDDEDKLTRHEKKRQRREERRKRILETRASRLEEHDAGTEAAAYAPGAVIQGADGTTYMVAEDGFAYQVEGDDEEGYRYVMSAAEAEGDAEEAQRQQERRHISEPHRISTPVEHFATLEGEE